jgi:hypothetical protein
LHGMHGVVGSIPIASTFLPQRSTHVGVGSH